MNENRAFDLTFAVTSVARDDGGKARFSGVAYSGGVIPAYGWVGDVAIDLSGLQNPDGDEIPVLENHDGRIEALAGKGRIFRADNSGITELRVEGELTSATEAGSRIAKLMSEGFPLQLSVGMSANLREVPEPIQVNGQTLKVTAVFEQPLIRECSFVPVGADPNTRVSRLSWRDAGSPSTPQHEDMPMTRSPEDQALIDGLHTQIEELSARLTAVQAERRAAEFAALCAEVGRDMPEGDALKPYLAMPEEAYAVFAADLRAVAGAKKPARDEALFRFTAADKALDEEAKRQTATLSAAVARLTGKPTTV